MGESGECLVLISADKISQAGFCTDGALFLSWAADGQTGFARSLALSGAQSHPKQKKTKRII